MLLVGAAPGRNLPDDLPTIMLGALFDTGVAGIGTDDVLRAMQQFVDLGNVCNVGRRSHHAVHQA
ncbi:hypothetical protein D9M70_579080 [compost metagenome]